MMSNFCYLLLFRKYVAQVKCKQMDYIVKNKEAFRDCHLGRFSNWKTIDETVHGLKKKGFCRSKRSFIF